MIVARRAKEPPAPSSSFRAAPSISWLLFGLMHFLHRRYTLCSDGCPGGRFTLMLVDGGAATSAGRAPRRCRALIGASGRGDRLLERSSARSDRSCRPCLAVPGSARSSLPAFRIQVNDWPVASVWLSLTIVCRPLRYLLATAASPSKGDGSWPLQCTSVPAGSPKPSLGAISRDLVVVFRVAA